MNINEKMQEFLNQKQQWETVLHSMEKEFKTYINNLDIPLIERWDYYLNAPSELKEDCNGLIAPNSRFLKEFLDIDFEESEYGKGKQIYIKNLFGDLIIEGKVNLEDYNYRIDDLTEEEVYQGMEELLRMNINYFIFDW